ncbi:MAG: hypothetical protein VKL59_15695 [Nostocaceae cyanobacterium]|nr:hypothetical protein [Nostocaceae cyanobacterium]
MCLDILADLIWFTNTGMGDWAWGMGHWALGIGHWAWETND